MIEYKQLLKTYLFECWDCGTLWLFVWIEQIFLLIYLLTCLLTYLMITYVVDVDVQLVCSDKPLYQTTGNMNN